MKLNPNKILFGDDDGKRPPVLLAVTPPRTGERTMLGVENMLQSIAVPEPFSLELAGDVDGVTLMARCLNDRVVRGQISAHYPQARIHEVPAQDDALRLDEGEEAWAMTLRASGPEYVPLRTFRDDDLLDPGLRPHHRPARRSVQSERARARRDEADASVPRTRLVAGPPRKGPQTARGRAARLHLLQPGPPPTDRRHDHGGSGGRGPGSPERLPVGAGR